MCEKCNLILHNLALLIFYLSFLLLTQRYVFIDEREREREREKHLLVASHTRCGHRSNLQHRHVPWLGIEPMTFGV